jgi:hypothetical protein
MILTIAIIVWIGGWLYSLKVVEDMQCYVVWWGVPVMLVIWPIFLAVVLYGVLTHKF